MKHIVLKDAQKQYKDYFVTVDLWPDEWIYIHQNDGFPIRVSKHQVKKLNKALKKWLKENK